MLTGCKDRSKQEAAEFFERGLHHFKKNELDDALRFFKEAVGKQPDLADAHNNIGLIYEKQGKLKEAEDAYIEAISKDEAYHQAIFNNSRVRTSLGKYELAEVGFGQVEVVYKDSADFYNERGRLYSLTSNNGNAMADFTRAISLQPENSVAYTNLGFVLFTENKLDEANKHLLKAISIDPVQATAYNNLSVIANEQKDFAKALAYAQKAVEIEKDNPLFINNYAYSFLNNGQLAEAKRELDKIANNFADNAYFLRNEGIYYLKKNDYGKALAKFQEAEAKDPGTRLIYYYLGRAYRALNRAAEAKMSFERGVLLKDGYSKAEL